MATWITPTEITPSSYNAWVDADLSSYLPSGATGAIFHVYCTSTGVAFGLRKNGSTDARNQTINSSSHMWWTCGVDANRIAELFAYSNVLHFILVGYFSSEAVFNTNATDISISATTTWTDIDINVNDSAIGAIVEAYHTSDAYIAVGMRKNGSTDARTDNMYRKNCFIVGLDANEVFEGYIGGTALDFYLTGYIKSGVTFNTNATDLSISTTGAYTDLSALPSGATGGFIEVICGSSNRYYHLRKNGSSEDLYYYARYHNMAFVECDTSRLIEAKIASTAVDMFLLAYTTGGTTYYQNTGGATVTPAGAQVRRTYKTVGGAAVTPAGAIIKKIITIVGEAILAPAGQVTKFSQRLTGGATITPAGGFEKALIFSESTGGATITPSGGIGNKAIGKNVGQANLIPAGAVIKQGYVESGGATITPTGALSESFVCFVDVGGATITPTALLGKLIIKYVGQAVVTPTGSIVKRIGKQVGGGTVTPIGSMLKGISKAVGGGTIMPIGNTTAEYIDGGGEPEPPAGLILHLRRFLRSIRDSVD